MGTSRALGKQTDLVIEGFPRSGNTFLVTALEHANPTLTLKSHVHFPAQVAAAVSAGLPTVVCLRRPEDSIASLVVAFPHIRIGAALREYRHHHAEMLKYADSIIVAPFELITHNTAEIVQAVNARWGLGLEPFSHSEADTSEVFARIDARNRRDHKREASERLFARPSALRRADQAWILGQLSTPRYRARLERAQQAYDALAQTSSLMP